MKQAVLVLLVWLCTAVFADAQRHKLATINTDTPEGKALQAIGTESDPGKKLALMEDFVQKYPKHDGTPWLLAQMQDLYTKSGNYDKAIASGEALLQLDPMATQTAYANLKAAEAKKDSDAIVKWSGVTADIAMKTPQSQKPSDMEDEEWKHELDFANQVIAYTEYALYNGALQDNDPKHVARYATMLEQRNPKSPYLEQIMPRFTVVARQANMLPELVAFGERAFARGQYNEDLLLAMADYSRQNKLPDKTITYSNKLVELMNSKPKPEGVSDTDWQHKKDSVTGLAYWLAGTTFSTQGKQSAADKALRAALPLIKSNDQLLAEALFHLGLVNYQMGRGKNAAQMGEALRFSQQCAAIKSPFQAQATKNVAVIQKEMGGTAARRAQ